MCTFVDWLVEAADVPGDTRRLAQFVFQRFHAMATRSPHPSLSREISGLCGTDSLSVSSLPLLGMGRDVPDGVLRLRGDRLDLDWTTASSEAYFERVLATMRRVAAVLGARCQSGSGLWSRHSPLVAGWPFVRSSFTIRRPAPEPQVAVNA